MYRKTAADTLAQLDAARLPEAPTKESLSRAHLDRRVCAAAARMSGLWTHSFVVAGFTRSSPRRACSAPLCMASCQTQSLRCASLLRAWQQAQRRAAPADAMPTACAGCGMRKSANVREAWRSSSCRIPMRQVRVRLVSASYGACR